VPEEDTFLKKRAELSATKLALLEKRLRLTSAQRQTQVAGTRAIVPQPGHGPVPLSFVQQRLWFLQQLEPDSPAYNETSTFRMSGPLQLAAFTQTIREIARRHTILRSTFPMIDGQVVQVVDPDYHLHLTLPFIDVRNVPQTERDTVFERRVTAEIQRPLHPGQEVPWRTVIFCLDEQEHFSLTIMHHLITDAWSMELFARELSLLYEAFCTGQPPSLPDLPLQYADYAHWQRREMQGGRFDRQLAYWKQQLNGPLPVLQLPTDRARPAMQTYNGQRLPLVLSPTLHEQLMTLSRHEGVTLFMTLLAAFQVLLYRYTGEDDVLIGTPIAGRTHPELESLMGCFVNTLVLRMSLGDAPSFRTLLKRVREMTLSAYDHQDVPFEKLVEDLQPNRSLSHPPLFQVMFVLQNIPMRTQELYGLSITPTEAESKTAKYDLSLCLRTFGRELTGYLEYNTDLFDLSTVERMAQHFQHVLEIMVEQTDSTITDFPLLSAKERHQISKWNARDTHYAEGICLHQLFEAQVERTPEAIAIIFEQKSLTYQALNEQANQLAHYLRRQGVEPDTLVGACMERSVELVIALLAILKAGGAYVPLDPTYPRERLAFVLQDAQVSILLTQERLRSKLADQKAHIIFVDSDRQTISQEQKGNPGSAIKPENLAYVIYTSGSTGKPKGAMNTHNGICNRLQWMQETYQLCTSDRVLQKTPFSFDVSVWEFFWPLLYGAELIIARPEGHRDSTYLVRLIVEHAITTVHFVPSMLRIFLEDPDIQQCTSLRRVICSGEALSFELQQRFFALPGMQDTTLHNLYGPTEASVDVTYWDCTRDNSQQIVPIGYPIANTQIYLLDGHFNQVPIGVPGELYIGGNGLGRGYLNRPELTAEKFIPNPFTTKPGARLYKTGDLARYLPHGAIEYLGRNDYQVKIRGNRIEVGEVEAVLATHPAVHDCAVIAREDASDLIGDRHLVAYIVARTGYAPTSGELGNFLREQLPEYMIPSIFVSLDALPLTPNGKLDRTALVAPNRERAMLESAYVAPRTATEKELTVIWNNMLGVERVGIHDNFFAMGGHSLLVTQVMARVRDTFAVELPLRILFIAPTIAGLAEAIKKAMAEHEAHRKPAIVAVSRKTYRISKDSLHTQKNGEIEK